MKNSLSVQQRAMDDQELVNEALREYATIRLQRVIVGIKRYCTAADAHRGVTDALRCLDIIERR